MLISTLIPVRLYLLCVDSVQCVNILIVIFCYFCAFCDYVHCGHKKIKCLLDVSETRGAKW